MAIDTEGGVAVSTTTQTWTRPSVIPTVSASNPVLEFGTTPDGDFAVLTQAGTAFQSEDGGLTWKTLPVARTERQEATVVNHTVKSGDTVWGIAGANNVSIAAVIDENSLPNNGSTISVGQVIRITKNGLVSTIQSPVIPDPSVVRSVSQTPTPSTPVDSSATDAVVSTPETPPVAPSVPDPSFPPLESLVLRNGQEGTTTYVVKRGDTLWGIARANRTTVSSLASLNTVSNINRIFIGQQLVVGSGTSTQQSFHRVQPGDTLPVISVRRSVALADLIRFNPTAPASGDLRDGILIRIS